MGTNDNFLTLFFHLLDRINAKDSVANCTEAMDLILDCTLPIGFSIKL